MKLRSCSAESRFLIDMETELYSGVSRYMTTESGNFLAGIVHRGKIPH